MITRMSQSFQRVHGSLKVITNTLEPVYRPDGAGVYRLERIDGYLVVACKDTLDMGRLFQNHDYAQLIHDDALEGLTLALKDAGIDAVENVMWDVAPVIGRHAMVTVKSFQERVES